MMSHLLNLAISSIFVNNIALASFLGMCSFIACSKSLRTAFFLGLSVTFVMAIATPMNWLIHHFLLGPGALSWMGFSSIDFSFLELVVFMAAIATLTHSAEMIIERYLPVLSSSLGIFLPLIAANCAILGVSLFTVQRQYTYSEAQVYGISAGIGWTLAIVAMAAIRKKLEYSDVPKGLRGFGITMIIMGLISMAFMLFSGIGS